MPWDIKKLKSGDEAEFYRMVDSGPNALGRRAKARAKNLLYPMSSRYAEDAVQDTFVSTIPHMHGLATCTDYERYFFRSLFNTCSKYRKKMTLAPGCPQCGRGLAPHAQFCHHCGNQV